MQRYQCVGPPDVNIGLGAQHHIIFISKRLGTALPGLDLIVYMHIQLFEIFISEKSRIFLEHMRK